MRWVAALWLACVLAVSSLTAVAAPAAEVTELHLVRGEDGVYLNAAVDFALPQLVEDALEKGIAVFFVAEADIYTERWYWTDRKVAHATRHMRLAYQPLTRRWRLNVSPVPITNAGFGALLSQNYDSLGEALEAVKRIGRLRLGDLADLGDTPAYLTTFRFRLDTSQLPRPFQIGVVGQVDWNISAEVTVRLPLERQR